jgi:hypothetical protein
MWRSFFKNNRAAQAKSTKDTALSNSCAAKAKRAFEIALEGVNTAMAFLFSDLDAHLRKEGVYKYCKVKTDDDGTRSFIFLLRRYNLVTGNQNHSGKLSITEEIEEEQGTAQDLGAVPNSDKFFSPGVWTVGETLGELVMKRETKVGLTAKDVEDRYHVVGRNTIEMDRPSFFRCVGEEIQQTLLYLPALPGLVLVSLVLLLLGHDDWFHHYH